MKLINFRSTKSYSAVTGAILFCVGFFGFAFRPSLSLPDKYLFACLILGFWGIVVAVYSSRK